MKRRKSSKIRPLFFNRDQSWLRFNMRVLEEAQDPTNPILERLMFLSITANNLDEFTEIRIAGQLQLIEDGYIDPHEEVDDGLTHQQRFDMLADQLHGFVYAQHHCWTHQIIPALAQQNIHILNWNTISNADREFALDYYEHEVDPLLTPITIDPSHPFPRVLNKALCMALLLRRKRNTDRKFTLGIVTVPRSLPRFVALPRSNGEHSFLPLQELIAARAEQMYPGYQILARTPFRITRNSNLYLQEEESASLLEGIRAELYNRRKGDVVRLEVESGADEQIIQQLRINFQLDRWQIFRTESPVNLARIKDLYSALQLPHLKFPPFSGKTNILPTTAPDIFEKIRDQDVMVHHPFDSYDAVESFIQAAARDERVIAIKQTLYRTTPDSPAFDALLEAGQEKDITVVVELMARFDEDSNIRWAEALEEAGVQVFHGIVGRKTHCKLALVVRRDEDGAIRRYAHLGTGNYNPVTARLYTDIGFFTARPDITTAVHHVFNYLTSESEDEIFDPLLVAPITLAQDILDLIRRETQHAQQGKPARIIAKMNALLDGPTVQALYTASQAGVEIDLIVRGMCSLRPGVPGLSDNIRVRSIVGRFLEHSRIYFFANAGREEIYSGSADWMQRNLHGRCEVLFPIADRSLKHRLRHQILDAYLRDNVKARLLEPDGEYIRAPRHGAAFSAQQFLMQQSAEAASPVPSTRKSVIKKAAAKTSKRVTKKASTRMRKVAPKNRTR